MLRRDAFKVMWFSVVVGALTLVPVVVYADPITNVTIYESGTAIATAPSGELGQPPAAPLTINGVTWKIGFGQALKYLQKVVTVRGTRNGAQYSANFKITSMVGDKVIKLAPP